MITGDRLLFIACLILAVLLASCAVTPVATCDGAKDQAQWIKVHKP